MTRWARANNIHKHKPAEATPWTQLRGGGGGGAAAAGGAGGSGGSGARPGPPGSSNQGPQRDRLRGTRPGGSAVKKPNRPKKDYVDEDVNGFLEFLQQSGRPLPRGSGGGGGGVGVGGELRQELETALKKDRRREDRRVKRQDDKKSNMLCFNCRKPGHGLADCPEADRDEEMGRGICYRCGSTEHEIQKCRAKVDPALGEHPYAKCFICSKTGHLSRGCPDNPKGLYAQGGACRVCGSVEHFQKDCPEHQAATNSVTVPWLSNNMSADHEDVFLPVKTPKPKATKVVMF